MPPVTAIAALLLLAGLVLIGLGGVRRVPEGQVAMVHRLGRYRRTLTPGWRWVVPGLDRVVHLVPLIGHHLSLAPRPLGGVPAQGEVYFQILEPERAGAALEEVDALVLRQADEALASVTPGDPDAGWPQAAEALKAELNRRTGRLGLRVTRCSLSPSV